MEIYKLLRSKNPFVIAVGVFMLLVGFAWGGVSVIRQVNDYTATFETKQEHAQDIDQRVIGFQKDVRIAILENNAVLLEALDRKMRRAAASKSEISDK